MEDCYTKKSTVFLITALFTLTSVISHPIQLKRSDSKTLNRHSRSILDLSNEDNSKESKLVDDEEFQENILNMLEKLFPERGVSNGRAAALVDKSIKRGLDPKFLAELLKHIKNTLNDQPDLDPEMNSKKKDDDDARISTVVRTWSKNDSTGDNKNIISGYKNGVDTTKRAGRLSINGALTSLADLLLSENQRRDRMETMELRQRLQYLG
ncbi:hypothetical protein SNE40_021472 [Patella caerulea]|uniref:Uncharacterized protein n=1 Tax=Patella caerulea TaxID=87958 RepID=A0AAN8IWQ3_PATCE